MGDFAENFIQGFMAGHRAKSEKERAAQDKERFEEAKKQHAEEFKLRQNESDIMTQAYTLDEKLKLLAFRRTQPAPLPDLSKSGGMGPPREEDFPNEEPVSLDFGGQHFKVPVVHQEEAMKERLMQLAEEQRIKDDAENVPLTSDIPQIGLKAGARVRPNELNAKVQLRGQDTALEAARTRAAAVGKGGMDINDPVTKAAVDNAADRVAAGEISVGDARGLLGGVKGGLGTHLLTALGERRALPTKVRVELGTLNQSRAAVRQVEDLVRDVQSSKGVKEKVENSLLLEQYINANATNLAKGYGGEVGRVTDQDAIRVKGIFPGWKAANFAPGYVEKELGVIRSGLDKREKAITTGYFQEVDKAGNRSKAPEEEADEYLSSLGGN